MTYLLRVISAALAFVMLSLGVAQAQECKAKAISATSRLYISKVARGLSGFVDRLAEGCQRGTWRRLAGLAPRQRSVN